MRRGGVAYFLVSGASAVALAQAAPAHADTLQEALTEAYLNNPSLLAARAHPRAPAGRGTPFAAPSSHTGPSTSPQSRDFSMLS